MGYGLWVMGYGLWVMGYGLWVGGGNMIQKTKTQNSKLIIIYPKLITYHL
jgi:hypothetical protein